MKKSIFLFLSFFILISKVSAMEGLWYYTETPRARVSLFKNLPNGQTGVSKINILGPQTYQLGMDGNVSSTMKDDVINLAQKNHVKIMPLLANINGKVFNQKTILNLLDHTDNWEKVSKYLREEAYRGQYYGWQRLVVWHGIFVAKESWQVFGLGGLYAFLDILAVS